MVDEANPNAGLPATSENQTPGSPTVSNPAPAASDASSQPPSVNTLATTTGGNGGGAPPELNIVITSPANNSQLVGNNAGVDVTISGTYKAKGFDANGVSIELLGFGPVVKNLPVSQGIGLPWKA